MESIGNTGLWIGFGAIVAAVLALDLWVGSKSDAPMSKRRALAWTALWVTLGCAFGGGIFVFAPEAVRAEKTAEFFSAYVIEYSLSVDNLFVFLLLFHAFRVPQGYQHRVLFWGILGAIVLRGLFIFMGTALLSSVHAFIYLFGAFLLYTGAKLTFGGQDDEDTDVSENGVVKFARRFIKVTDEYHGHHFFAVVEGVRRATPLLLVAVCVELSDVLFAVDSVPAVFGISLDPFVVYTSNIFAILGLRSLFFLLSGALWGLRFLKPSLGLVLAFIGAKMCLPLVHWAAVAGGVEVGFLPHEVPTVLSLIVVGTLLAGAIVLSLVFPGRKPEQVEAAEEVKEDIREVITGDDVPAPRGES